MDLLYDLSVLLSEPLGPFVVVMGVSPTGLAPASGIPPLLSSTERMQRGSGVGSSASVGKRRRVLAVLDVVTNERAPALGMPTPSSSSTEKMQRGSPTFRTSPTLPDRDSMVPSYALVTSIVDLSDWTRQSRSYCFTASPGATSHSTISPSRSPSPVCYCGCSRETFRFGVDVWKGGRVAMATERPSDQATEQPSDRVTERPSDWVAQIERGGE